MKIDMISIGERIRYRRKELQLTQTDIKNACGISTGSLSEIENGIRTPSVLIFYSLSQILKCSMDWLATGTSPNTESGIVSEYGESAADVKLLADFHQLDFDDQDELLVLLDLKLRKARRGKSSSEKSSASMTTEKADMVG